MPETQSLHSFRRDLISQFLASSSSSSSQFVTDGGGAGIDGGGPVSLNELPPRIAGEFGAAVSAEHGRFSQGGTVGYI